jgi:hypothetical protein
MTTWTDPLIVGAVVLICLAVIRGLMAFRKELVRRKHLRFSRQKDLRILIVDYRAKYGRQSAVTKLKEDIEESRSRVERLAASWKDCQKKAEEAVEPNERHSMEGQERKAYQAFLNEAKHHQRLREAHEHLRR